MKTKSNTPTEPSTGNTRSDKKPTSKPAAVAPEKEEANKPLGFRLEKLDQAHPYLSDRGLTPETVMEFGLGFCAKGMMANRIAIPIRNPEGKVVAYAGRTPEEPTGDVAKYKLVAFVLSAALSGLAGATKTVVFQLASLTDAHWHTSGEVVLMTLLGGLGTVFGPVVGAFVVVGLQNQLADKVGSWVQVIMGTIFVVCVLAFRRGIVGELAAWWARRKA
jgi:hypothetical protein